MIDRVSLDICVQDLEDKMNQQAWKAEIKIAFIRLLLQGRHEWYFESTQTFFVNPHIHFHTARKDPCDQHLLPLCLCVSV